MADAVDSKCVAERRVGSTLEEVGQIDDRRRT